jgi:hypothetical protein
VGVRVWGGGRGEKWPKHCMHIWIIKKFKNKFKKTEFHRSTSKNSKKKYNQTGNDPNSHWEEKG